MKNLLPGYVCERYRHGDFEIEIEGPAEWVRQQMTLQIHLHLQDVPLIVKRGGIVRWEYPGGLSYPIALAALEADNKEREG